MINQICAQYIGNYASWAVWIWLVAMGILFGVLGIYLGQVYVMVCTAFGGAQSTMVGVAVGIIAAIIAVKYIGLSMFITGCFMGIYVGVMINQICAQYIGNYASWAVWIWLVAMGILFGVLGIYP